jgi:hypothetical protein
MGPPENNGCISRPVGQLIIARYLTLKISRLPSRSHHCDHAFIHLSDNSGEEGGRCRDRKWPCAGDHRQPAGQSALGQRPQGIDGGRPPGQRSQMRDGGHRLRRTHLRRRRRHLGICRTAAIAPFARRARCHRGEPHPVHRRHARHGARRRAGAGARLRLAHRRRKDEVWPSGSQSRPDPRRRRHPAPAPRYRARTRRPHGRERQAGEYKDFRGVRRSRSRLRRRPD